MPRYKAIKRIEAWVCKPNCWSVLDTEELGETPKQGWITWLALLGHKEVQRRVRLLEAFDKGDLYWRRFRGVELLPDNLVPPEVLRKCRQVERRQRRREAING